MAAYAQHGTAFALYLTLDGVDKYVGDTGSDSGTASDPEASTIELNFKDAYYGRFDNREAIVADTIASFDWGIELDRLLADHPLLRKVVAFDRSAILNFVEEYYEVLEETDGLYVFERW